MNFRKEMFNILKALDIKDDEVVLVGNVKRKVINPMSNRKSGYRGVSANGKKW